MYFTLCKLSWVSNNKRKYKNFLKKLIQLFSHRYPIIEKNNPQPNFILNRNLWKSKEIDELSSSFITNKIFFLKVNNSLKASFFHPFSKSTLFQSNLQKSNKFQNKENFSSVFSSLSPSINFLKKTKINRWKAQLFLKIHCYHRTLINL